MDEAEPIHLRHVKIGDYEIKWLVGSPSALQGREGCSRSVDCLRTKSPLREHFEQNDSIRLIVIDYENAGIMEYFGIGNFALSILVFRDSEMDCEMESTAAAQFAVNPDLPSHHFHQTRDNPKSEPRSPVEPCGGTVCLSEGGENFGLLVFRDSNAGVTHREMQLYFLGQIPEFFNQQKDFSVFCEFQSVTNQVNQDLT